MRRAACAVAVAAAGCEARGELTVGAAAAPRADGAVAVEAGADASAPWDGACNRLVAGPASVVVTQAAGARLDPHAFVLGGRLVLAASEQLGTVGGDEEIVSQRVTASVADPIVRADGPRARMARGDAAEGALASDGEHIAFCTGGHKRSHSPPTTRTWHRW